ncbi:MAG: alkaline phosphatase family protein [Armatimonadetes bacterium]|nr:alkaline phosphatase family protein [Armatimonadota bacterium]
MSSTNKLRLVVYGIDSADWQVMQPFLEAGDLPNLAELMERGSHGTLESTIPPITAVAWPAAFTGTNPGKHGLFYFFHLRDGRVRAISNADRRKPALWEMLSEAGLRVGTFTVPFTYPADEIEGWMVAGRGGGHAWDERSVRPSELHAELEPLLRQYPDFNLMMDRRDPRKARLLMEGLSNRVGWARRLLGHLLERHPVDVLIAVENITDTAQHKFITSRRLGQEQEDMVRWAYQQADETLGLMRRYTDDDTVFLLLSDHGAQPIAGYFDHAAWLAQQGYLHYHAASPSAFLRRRLLRLGARAYHTLIRSLRLRSAITPLERVARFIKFYKLVDWSRTRAFSWPGGGIIINTPGRSPNPTVAPEDREALAREIRDRLEEVDNPITGRRDLKAYLREELYEGPCIEEAPDVFVAPSDFAVAVMNSSPPPRLDKAFWTEEELRQAGLGYIIACEGEHRRQGIVVLSPAPQALPPQARIMDIAPTVLALLGLPVPDYMDGRSLIGAERREEAPAAERRAEADMGPVYTEEEEEQIARRLADLGYL